jgi:adrenodoxin-NADP+ reductase
MKTGPIGVLTCTLYDAAETARSIIDDIALLEDSKHGLNGLKVSHEWTTYQDWIRINQEEIRRGKLVGKPREKLTSLVEMKKYTVK